MGKIIKKHLIELEHFSPKNISIELNGGLKNEKNQVIHIQSSNWRIQMSKDEFDKFVKLNTNALNELRKYKKNI